jgi:hypothetical protein
LASSRGASDFHEVTRITVLFEFTKALAILFLMAARAQFLDVFLLEVVDSDFVIGLEVEIRNVAVDEATLPALQIDESMFLGEHG